MNAAELRLDLGLGGHSANDTRLFGARSLSLPGFLTNKNIMDIENNVVTGNTTWKHQNAYAMMMIAGCMSQAKKILESFDEILYGPSPEKLVELTHKSIIDILASVEAQDYFKKSDTTAEENETLIKRIVEAVSPIIPVSIRNKMLDGTYFRTALHLLGAAEFLFSQYKSDVRSQANPAGFVGMCNVMHSEIKRAAVQCNGLKPLDDFMKDMKSEYNTSLGLGQSFGNDVPARDKRRGRNFGSTRARPWSRSSRGEDRDSTGGQQTRPIQSRGRGLCYAYQAGSCTRGGSCRFMHQNA